MTTSVSAGQHDLPLTDDRRIGLIDSSELPLTRAQARNVRRLLEEIRLAAAWHAEREEPIYLDHLADKMDCSIATVKRAVAAAQDAGLLTVTRYRTRDGRADGNCYRIEWEALRRLPRKPADTQPARKRFPTRAQNEPTRAQNEPTRAQNEPTRAQNEPSTEESEKMRGREISPSREEQPAEAERRARQLLAEAGVQIPAGNVLDLARRNGLTPLDVGRIVESWLRHHAGLSPPQKSARAGLIVRRLRNPLQFSPTPWEAPWPALNVGHARKRPRPQLKPKPQNPELSHDRSP